MAATLIVDASFGDRGVAGWACWVKADHSVMHAQGGIIECLEVTNAAEAELVACLHGLNVASKHAPGHAVLLQSDCFRALVLMNRSLGFPDRPHRSGLSLGKWKGTHRVTDVERRVLEGITVLLRRYPTEVSVRHVKGHAPGRGGRHRVNEWCDRLAKTYMREARARSFEAGTERLVRKVVDSGVNAV